MVLKLAKFGYSGVPMDWGAASSSAAHKNRRAVWNRESWLRKTELKLKPAIWKLGIKRAAKIAVALGLVWYTYREIRRPVLIIEPISVPKEYEESGFSSSVMSRRVVKLIETIQRDVEIQARKDTVKSAGASSVALLAEQEARLDFEVPGIKLSLQTIISFIRELVHAEEPHLSTEVVFAQQKYLPTGKAADSQQYVEIRTTMSRGTSHGTSAIIRTPKTEPDAVIISQELCGLRGS
jgi:hypothetical protein